MESKPTYIDLFAGCGGLSLGLHQAGWQGLFAVEKNADAFKTLEHNLITEKKHFLWPESWLQKRAWDINQLLLEHKTDLLKLIGKVELVTGGPPCQGFSTAGKRRESDLRNSLIKSYLKFIMYVQPKIIFFENVRGFTLKFDKNKTKGVAYSQYVTEMLDRLGYHVHGQLVNFGDYGIPQKRVRFILVGIRKSVPNSSIETAEWFFKQLKINKTQFLAERNIDQNTNLGDAISDLLKSNGEIQSPDTKRFNAGIYSTPTSAYQKLMRKGIDSPIVDSHRFPQHRPDIIGKFQYILGNCKKNKEIDKEVRTKFGIKKHTIIPLDENEKSPTITSLPDDYIHYIEPRIMTVREYARIQSFPDSYHFKGKYTSGGKMRTKEVPRYTQIGNAIPPLFGEQSGLVLKKYLV